MNRPHYYFGRADRRCLEAEFPQKLPTFRLKVFVRAAVSYGIVGLVFLTALSDDVYAVTLPAALPHHTLLRKGYALVAFAVAGGVLAPMLRSKHRTINTAIAMMLLSTAIEVAQRLLGSGEWWRWMAFDIASGFAGGFIGAVVYLSASRMQYSRAFAEPLRASSSDHASNEKR